MAYKIVKHDVRWVCHECGKETLCDMIESTETAELKGFECQVCTEAWWVFPPDGLALDKWREISKGCV